VEFNFQFFSWSFCCRDSAEFEFWNNAYNWVMGNRFSLNPAAEIFSLIFPSFVGDWPLGILGEECRNPKIKIVQAEIPR